MTYKQLRTYLGLSQSEMGRLVGITRGAWQAIENGRRNPGADVKYRLNIFANMINSLIDCGLMLLEIKTAPWYKKPFIKFDFNPISIKNTTAELSAKKKN